nr:DNA-3-methyladenine glycosylase [Synechococcus sp. CB0205]
MASTPSQHLSALPQSFFSRPAQAVAHELIGCRLVKREPSGALLWGVIVGTEAYSQEEPDARREFSKSLLRFTSPACLLISSRWNARRISRALHRC